MKLFCNQRQGQIRRLRKWHSFTKKKGVSSRLRCSISSYTHTCWTIMIDHFLGQIYRKKTLLTSMISNLKSCSDAQMANNTTRMIIIINMYGFEKIKRVMRIAVAITVLRFMVTHLCMLPVNKYRDDPTLGERHNKQYTNKYIVVYIFEHRQSTTTHGQGNNKSGRRSSRQGWTRFKPILNYLDVKPCDSQSYNNTTCDLKSCLCM